MADGSAGAKSLRTPPIQLRWSERTRRVTVSPADQDLFVVSVQEAIEACRAHAHRKKFEHQFKALLGILAEWVDKRREQIRNAIVTLQEDAVLFLVVRKEMGYDRTFEDDLTRLDMEVAQHPNLDVVRLTVLALPNCSDEALAGFINPEVYLVYGSAK